MTTEIITYNDKLRNRDGDPQPCTILLNRYWDDEVRSTMIQIMEKNPTSHHVDTTEKEFMFMFYKYISHENDEIEDKDTLYDGHIRRLKENRKIIEWLNKRYRFKVDKDE